MDRSSSSSFTKSLPEHAVTTSPLLVGEPTSEPSKPATTGTDLTQYYDLFSEQGARRIDEYRVALSRLDPGHSDPRALLDLVAAAHSIKVDSAVLGFYEMSELMRLVEYLFEQVRRGERAVNEQMVDHARQSIDFVEQMFARLKSSGSTDVADLRRQLDSLAMVR